MPLIETRAPEIRRRHYLRYATTPNYWFDFSKRRLDLFRSRFGDDFCLIINGSRAVDDAYIVPYSKARQAFVEEALDHRGRWIGTIRGSLLVLTPSGNSLDVASYHNAFELLET